MERKITLSLTVCSIRSASPFLTLISRLAKEAGDPDWEYPLTLQEGVPLGVDEPTLTLPGIWPTKEELRGIPDEYEELASPVGRHNYDSAEDFSDAIKQTFEEEKLLDMAEGPFTKQEAANRCKCSPSQLCPGLIDSYYQSMMAVLEVRTPTYNKTPPRRQQHQR